MGRTALAMEWQNLGDLVREFAPQPKQAFEAKHGTPFLVALDAESGEAVETGETRVYDPSNIKAKGPSLASSKLLPLNGEATFVLGRNADCPVTVLHDTVSQQHCCIEQVGTMWSLKDLGSKNGTQLNGKPVNANDQVPLKFNSKITLGEAQVLFLSPDDAWKMIQELSKEPRIRPRSLGKYTAEFKQAGSTEAACQQYPGPFLIVQAPKGRDASPNAPVDSNTVTLSQEELKKGVDKNVADAVFYLGNHTLVRIGRATVTQIHLPLAAISTLHAAILRENDEWYVQDLGAKNGTYLWGEQLEGRKKIDSGTEILLGNIKAIFFNTEDLITYATHRDTLV